MQPSTLEIRRGASYCYRRIRAEINPAFLCEQKPRAQLFEDRLELNPGLNLNEVSFSCVQKHFLG